MISYCSGVEIAYICLVKESEATHTGEKSHECAVCGQRWGLKQHMLIHTGEKSHEFDVFGNRFALSSNLMTHTGEKLHECALCGQGFMGVKTTYADTYRRDALLIY